MVPFQVDGLPVLVLAAENTRTEEKIVRRLIAGRTIVVTRIGSFLTAVTFCDGGNGASKGKKTEEKERICCVDSDDEPSHPPLGSLIELLRIY